MGDDLLGVGIYSVPDVSRLTGIEAATLRRWLRGYHFDHHGAKKFSGRVIYGQLPTIADTLAMSFLDLQESRCLQEFRKRHIAWKTLREMHEEARQELGTKHPFSTGQFKTVGRRIMRDYATKAGEPVLLDLAKNQTTFRTFLEPYLRGLEFLNDVPVRWFPLDGSRLVVVDPKHGFGRPTIIKRGIATEVLANAYQADGSFESVAAWYDIDVDAVKDAVRFEGQLAAAA